MPGAASCPASRAATTSAHWRAALACTCACWPASEGPQRRRAPLHRFPIRMNQPLTLHELRTLAAGLLQPAALTELALLLACLGLPWLMACLGLSGLIVWRRRRGLQERPRSVLFGRHVVDGVLFPVLALLLALGARRLLPLLGVPPAGFKLVIPGLISLVLIRLPVRVLWAALPQSGAVRLIERTVSWLA